MQRLLTIGLSAGFCLTMSLNVACAQLQSLRERNATGKSVTFQHDGQIREYRIHIPKNYTKHQAVPLFVFLHGGGGDSIQGSKMGLSKVSEKHGFIAVYPNAVNKNWNDGRKMELRTDQELRIDDVDFIASVVDRVKKEYNVNAKRVFCAGISNGGFMTQRMAIEKSHLFAASGLFVASMGSPLRERFKPKLPMSMIFINGTDDPLVPYDGGSIQVNLLPKLNRLLGKSPESRGKCIATEEVVSMWVKRNAITSEPDVTNIPDVNTSDGSHVAYRLWKGGEQGTAVALYKVIGGGHTIPGGMQYLPERFIGKVNRDIEGFETMWQFFSEHARN